MKARWLVSLLAIVVLSTTLGCAVIRVIENRPVTPTRFVAQPPVVTVQATFTPAPSPTPSLTATTTGTPTHTPAPTATPIKVVVVPSPTPAPATDTPEPTDTPKPKAPKPAAPTNTPVPPTNTPAPFVTAHGVVGTLSLADPQPEYGNGAAVKIKWTAKNNTSAPILFGILGLGLSTNQFQTSRSGPFGKLEPGEEISATDTVRPSRIGNQIRGPVTIVLSMCFSKYDVCSNPGADWENIAPPLTIQIIP